MTLFFSLLADIFKLASYLNFLKVYLKGEPFTDTWAVLRSGVGQEEKVGEEMPQPCLLCPHQHL